MPKYGLIVCFSPVIKVEWANISSTGTSSAKNWELENGKKIRVLAIQLKLVILEKKLQCQAISIM